jgi:TRAP-type C4-dicarboxylate transport system permease small subunit
MRHLLLAPRVIIGALILFSIALNFANVIGRKLFEAPIVWAEETMIFIMIWCVFLGAIVVTWDWAHLGMDLFVARLRDPWRRIVAALTAALTLCVAGFVAWQSWHATSLFARLGQKSVVAGIPMVVPHAALTVGFAAIFLIVGWRLVRIVAGRDTAAK